MAELESCIFLSMFKSSGCSYACYLPLTTSETVAVSPQSLGLVLVHAHSRLATNQLGHNRTSEEGPLASRMGSGDRMWPGELGR